jgi:hypothetical protein
MSPYDSSLLTDPLTDTLTDSPNSLLIQLAE